MTRTLIGAALAGVLALPLHAQDCGAVRDVLYRGGAVHTMDAAGTVARDLHVVADRIAAVGDGLEAGPCTETVDLGGRTVIPGLIDNHNHIVLLGLRPGHDVRLENARSIDEALAAISERAAGVPPGEWITAIGGFNANQFTTPPEPPRLPTLAELDAAAPDHPVLVLQGFSGPSVANTPARDHFVAAGVAVAPDGAMEGGFGPTPSSEALLTLRDLPGEDHVRGTVEALDYAESLGITTHFDQGGFDETGTPADGAASFDPATAYGPVRRLAAEGRLTSRVRLNFLYMETDPQTPDLRARLANAFPEFGGEMLRVVGIGEFTAGASPIIAEWTDPLERGTRAVAEAGWRNENHSLTPTDYAVIIDAWTAIHEDMPAPGLSELGWVLAHAPFITEAYARKLKALGGGVSVLGGWRWLSGTAEANGPPFRMLVDVGIPVGMSSDGMQISPLNPWIGLSYVVTGRNARGELINEGQTLGRDEALRLYTAANGWFLREAGLGVLEPGAHADFAVLSADYFDAAAVPDDAIDEISSVLTVVAGAVVHDRLDE